MAGKIKKGFTSYLVVLLIAIVAAFLLCITIMLFSPFKNILGFKYFVYSKEIPPVYNETGSTSGMFDFANIQEINVNCSYASVIVERTKTVDSHAIKFTNLTSGFAKADQNTDFDYELSYEDASKTVLNISVHEPEGFLYFNKKVEIKILVPYQATYSLSNTKIDITNTSGNIYIGNNSEITNVGENEIDLNSLSVKTNSGKILIFPYIEQNIENLFLKSQKGEIEVKKDIIVSNQLNVYSNSGDVTFSQINYLNASDYVLLDLENSKFTASLIKGNVNLMLNSGNFDVDKIEGSVVSNNATKQMGNAKIVIGEVTGAVSLPFLNNTSIRVKEINSGSDFYAHSTKGNIIISKTNGKVYAETASGDIVVKTTGDDIDLKTQSGDINVVYDSVSIANQLDLASIKGKINMKVKSELAFTLSVLDTSERPRTNNVNISFIDGKFTNPLKINDGTQKVVVISNGQINISLIEG